MRRIALEDVAAIAAKRVSGRIDVFFFDCAAGLIDGDVLDGPERARWARFATPQLRDRFRHCHNTKRAILACYLRQSAHVIAFEIGPYEKPVLDRAIEGAQDLHFNLSHSGNWGALAIATAEVGIDCERIDRNTDYRELLGAVAHPRERIVDRDAFYRMWTRKEAVLKQLGLGFGIEPTRVEVPVSAAALEAWQRASIDGRNAPWVLDISAPGGMFAAVAARDPHEVRVFHLSAADARAVPRRP